MHDLDVYDVITLVYYKLYLKNTKIKMEECICIAMSTHPECYLHDINGKFTLTIYQASSCLTVSIIASMHA